MSDHPHHPIFARFPPYVGERPKDTIVDYIGARFHTDWNRSAGCPHLARYATTIPEFNEEYFEWIDLLESLVAAGPSYTMIELGAAYGRWGVRAGAAAKLLGRSDLRLVFVEGEPQHVAWLRGAISANGLNDHSIVHESAISYSAAAVPFIIGHESRAMGFGQCAGWENGEATGETYFGKPVQRTGSGYKQIFVAPQTLEQVVEGLGEIDLIDMDLQRAELELVKNSIATLDAQVRRVHIGTHSHEIEHTLRETFADHGWRKVWDFACLQTNATPYGEIKFTDGVQGWINPRLTL